MASMRRLRRRLLCWERYADQIDGHLSPREHQGRPRSGYWRAFEAVHGREERIWEQHGTWMGGPAGEAALIADVLGCCLAGNDGHDGPCVIRCEGCDGDSRCPECHGVDDLGCWYCEGAGCCPRGCDDGELVLEEWTPARIPAVVTEHAFAERGLL